MKSMLILKKLKVSNANAISGLTWGFPAITNFLGFTHALSRFTDEKFGVKLRGCGVICHDFQHKTQTNAYGRHSFALTRNPLTRKGETAPFNEEGKMHLSISLVIDADFFLQELEVPPNIFDKEGHLLKVIETKINTMRLAGGQIESIESVKFASSDSQVDSKTFRRQLRGLLPGFALVDRSPLLQSHYQQLKAKDETTTMMDAWLDFSAIKFAPVEGVKEVGKSVNVDAEHELKASESDNIEWQYQPKPGAGYLVPLMVGYKDISPLYESDEVKNTRDHQTPIRFVESAYGVGQWLSPHRITQPDHLLWQYQPEEDWYLCSNQYQVSSDVDTESTNQIQSSNDVQTNN